MGRLEELQPGDPDHIGPYLLLARLGVGGMGQVFLGRSPGGWLVAVKVIRAEMAADPEFRARFVREVVAARKVSGLFTAAVVDANPEARLPWLVTGFVNGPSLAQAVDEHGPLPASSVLALAAGLAEGLGAVHAAGVVHRDLKPSNVLLAADGPRVIDFGISRAADKTALTSAGMMIGSPGFMSPEQADGRVVGPASDVFGLGAVLVFAATGTGPFGEGPPSAQLYRVIHVTPSLDGLPSPLVSLVGRCLAKDPGQRPTAAQFLAEFRAANPPAADLADWLPASIPPLISMPSASADHLPEQAPPVSAPSETTASPPAALAVPPAVVTPGPSASEAGWTPTLTAFAQDRPGRDSAAAPPPPGRAEPASTARARGEPEPSPPVAARKRRRRLAALAVAVVVILGTVIGVLIAAPWKKPPVLRPTGLVADTSTVNSVAFRWSGPAEGPAPDRYEILRDGRRVGSVPGNITFYQDKGLAPASSHQFQVVAVRDRMTSRRSAALMISTVTPPVSAAILDGSWDTTETIMSLSHSEPWAKAGDKWSDSWSFTPHCSSGPCDVGLAGTLDGYDFTASLSRDGAAYSGTAHMSNISRCRKDGDTRDTVHISIKVQDAGASIQRWVAQSWSGSVIITQPRVDYTDIYCYASTFKMNIGSQ